MGFSDKKCDGCAADHDFAVYASMHCVKHKKDYCWECEKLGHGCDKDEVRCQFVGITNPQWIANLRNTLEKKDT